MQILQVELEAQLMLMPLLTLQMDVLTYVVRYSVLCGESRSWY